MPLTSSWRPTPSQRLITTEMGRVLPGVKDGTVKLADAIDSIEQATQQQFVQNVQRYNRRNGMIPATEACNGTLLVALQQRPLLGRRPALLLKGRTRPPEINRAGASPCT